VQRGRRQRRGATSPDGNHAPQEVARLGGSSQFRDGALAFALGFGGERSQLLGGFERLGGLLLGSRARLDRHIALSNRLTAREFRVDGTAPLTVGPHAAHASRADEQPDDEPRHGSPPAAAAEATGSISIEQGS
jgi:hypothetical protein